MHIPIKDMNYFHKNITDCIYLFAWNHKREIFDKEKNLKENGFLMLNYKNKIVFTGGTGRFGKNLKKKKKILNLNFIFLPRKN